MGKTICCSAVCIMTLSWKSELFFFLDKQAFPRPDVLFPFPLLRFGSCVSLPCLRQHPSRCQGLSVHGWDGESWLLVWREGITQVASYRGVEQHCCCGGGREDDSCLRGELGSECWVTETQVLLRCGGPVSIPFSPWWALVILQQKRFYPALLFFSAFLHAQHPFRSVAWHITWKAANSVMKSLS